MATATIGQLTLAASALDADIMEFEIASSGLSRRITKKNFIGATLTGLGTIATGGNALTVGGTSSLNGAIAGNLSGSGTIATAGFTGTLPATGTFALLGVAQTFAKPQIVDVAVNTEVPLILKAASGASVNVQEWYRGGALVAQLTALSSDTHFGMSAFDNGASYGTYITLQRNNNGSTPAAGWLQMILSGGTQRTMWVDNAGNLRLATVAPTNANDTAGTVVGTQTSHAASKVIMGDPVNDAEALDFICAAAAKVARFVYKAGSFNGEEFSGLVLDGETHNRYGMDIDKEHPAGKSLNVINAIGDLFLAVRGLTAMVKEPQPQT